MTNDPALPPEMTPTEMMQEQFKHLREHLEGLSASLRTLQKSQPDEKDRLEHIQDWIFCMNLAMTLYTEANQAVQTGTWFAATGVSASALEAVLLARCFLEEEKIKALPKWSTLKRSHRGNFGLFMRSMDLGKLLEIADSLSWFPPDGFPETFVQWIRPYADDRTVAELTQLFATTPKVGQACANHLRDARNLLHPAVCLREGRQPSTNVGISATFLFLIAFSALITPPSP
jgi:hypothetical protein